MKALLVLLVKAYRAVVAPCLPPSCRFEPSCSAYMLEALQTHGAPRGLLLGLWRILRCNPWCNAGYDPVPPAQPPGVTRGGRRSSRPRAGRAEAGAGRPA